MSNNNESTNKNTLPEISPDEITFGSLLGKGAFSKVYQGKCRGQEVAVKIFEGAKNDEQELESIRAEIKVMSQIYNQNVVLFLGACTDPNKELMIVTEKMPSDLNKILIEQKDKYPLSLRKRMKMAKEAALGVNWLHCSNPMFIHRDLKPSNLLVTVDYHVKVADFGLTKMKDKTSKKQNNAPQGSPAYMAPEVFMGEYDEKCDVYSFGMVLWEIYQQEKVFKDYPNLPSLMHAVIDEGVRPEIPKNCPSRLRKLMQRCWDEDPKKRPSMSKVVAELENVILDVSIQDHAARKMWREKLNSENSVPWSVFAKCVCQELQYEETPTGFDDFNALPLELKCLQEVVAQKPKNKKIKYNTNGGLIVKVKLFGAMVQCFGPFDKGFLKRVSKLICSKWFHGNVSQQDAENTLTKSDIGAFLVRFSSSPGYFTLSVYGKKQMEHHRIINVPGHGCYVWSAQFQDIFDVIKEGKNKKLLKKPCSGSPYKHLYEAKKKPAPSSAYNLPTVSDINRAELYK